MLPKLLDRMVRTPARRRDRKAGDAVLLRRLAEAPRSERRRVALEAVLSHVSEVLGSGAPRAIGTESAFKDLGFDSLGALELRNRLNVATGLRLAATVVFDHPNPESLVDHVLEEIEREHGAGVAERGGEGAPAPAPVGIEADGPTAEAPAEGEAGVAGLVKSASDEELFEFIDRLKA